MTERHDGKGIVAQLTTTQKLELQEAFDLFDKDGDGTISANELGSLFRCFGSRKTPEELDEILKKYDDDGSGEIEFEEFVAMMAETILQPDIDPELHEAYRVFDRDDGGISPNELQVVLAKFGYMIPDSEVQDMVDWCDWDGDGQLSFDEFALIMMGKAELDLND